MGYDAFISYSHAADDRLAPALQRGLQRLARPWYRRRALEVFRDQTGLGVSPALWTSIRTALADSQHFVLLACPEAAESKWVNQEIEHWLKQHPVDRILPVVTSGEWVWDAARNDFDWERSTAVPPALRGVFREEPRHLDLRWARTEAELDLRHGRFRDSVAELAATMHGMSKEDLDSEDVARHRRAIRLRRSVLAVFGLLLVLAGSAGALAQQNAQEAASAAAEASRQQRVAEQQRSSAATSAAEAQRQQQIAGAEQQRARQAAEEARQEKGNAAEAAEQARRQRSNAAQAATDARQQRSNAARAASDARQQRAVADKQQARATTATTAAERQRNLALEEKRKADKAAEEARRQRGLAERQLALATTATAEAERQRNLAAEEQLKAKEAGEEASKQEQAAREYQKTAHEQQQAAREQTRIAIGRRLVNQADSLRQNDPRTAVRLGIAAAQIHPSVQAEVGLVNALTAGRFAGTLFAGYTEWVRVTTFSADGTLLVSASSDRTLRLWDLHDVDAPVSLTRLTGEHDIVESMVLSQDAKVLAVDTIGGGTLVYDLSDRRQPRYLTRITEQSPNEPGQQDVIALSADGRTLVSTDSTDGGAVVYDLTDLAQLRPLARVADSDARVSALVLSADGRTLVTSSSTDTVVWDLGDRAKPQRMGALPELAGKAASLALSADGRTLAAAQAGQLVSIWDLSDRANPSPTTWLSTGVRIALSADGHTLVTTKAEGYALVWDLRQPDVARRVDGAIIGLSADGQTLAVGGRGNTAHLWDLSGSAAPRSANVIGHNLETTSAAVSADGKTLVTGSRDQTAIVWDLSDPAAPRQRWQLEGHQDLVQSVAVSADGRTVATSSTDSVRLWDTADLTAGGTVVHTDVPPARAPVVALSSDGRLLAVAIDDGTVLLWDVTDRRAPRPLSRFAAVGDELWEMALSADGKTLAATTGGQTELWDLTSPTAPQQGAVLSGSGRMSFSADGRMLAAAGDGGVVRLLDTTDPRKPRQITQVVGDDVANGFATLSPDGRTLATDSPGMGLQLWDLTDRTSPRRLPLLAAVVRKWGPVTFSADGKTLVTVGGEQEYGAPNVTSVWNLTPLQTLRDHVVARACTVAGGLTENEWAQYVPDLPYERSCW
ncbi:TIR domain-containing protein [Actinoplanes sp. NPDC051859]|uniref:TIR domain-containing protein n=1 Tax=Actinoplanes sp. NPDC051859 TaxID=3363909 RepID=UPI0037A5E857